MEQEIVFLTLLGMLAVTYVPRVLPVLMLSSRRLPPAVVAWLRYVPVAVLAVSAGAVAWALSRLDPVAIIERR